MTKEWGDSRDNCCHGGPRGPRISRRQFAQVTGLGLATVGRIGPTYGAMAGPFGNGEKVNHLIPTDKRLASTWVAALFERGEPEVWRGDELRHIGMPIGGICCGQLYLGGDGRLWHWDIFETRYNSDYSQGGMSHGKHYADPPTADSQIKQGFALHVLGQERSRGWPLSADGFEEIAFRGEYPQASVSYRDGKCPVDVDLTAYAPFIPLNAIDSALPATVMSFSLRNKTATEITLDLAGWLENAVCPSARERAAGVRRNEIAQQQDLTSLVCTAAPALRTAARDPRPDIVFADFEQKNYNGWEVSGTAFGDGPKARSDLPKYQRVSEHRGERFVNSHNAEKGEDIREADAHTGRLLSREFTINRRYVRFRIGGGKHPGKTCVDLLIDGERERSATGHNANRMREESFDVGDLEGRIAQLAIVDEATGDWGNVGVDHIVFTDEPPEQVPLKERPGYGSMALSLLGESTGIRSAVDVPDDLGAMNTVLTDDLKAESRRPFDERLVGALSRRVTLAAGESTTITFLVSWWFPNYPNVDGEWAPITDIHSVKRHYRKRFNGAQEVAAYVAQNFERLSGETQLWNKTWYDSTLPYWLLDRTFVTLDCLASQTCHWFDNGRFYGWEGVDCCPGTCQHVWNYAQGLARIFPQLERSVREQVDFGIAFNEDGALDYRAESGRQVAIDGQCGTILRAYREHLTSADTAYLKRVWPRVRRAIEFVIEQDGDANGLLEGAQYNTLDQAWYGPMAWTSSLYLAAVAAGEAMGRALGHSSFAERCLQIRKSGSKNIVEQLYDGEYFIHKPDPKHPNATNTNDGCHIDQVFGQSFCWQLGLPRVVPKSETESALHALWKYNFTPDAGLYHKEIQPWIKGGRWYAMPGEAGLLMTTWPKGGAEKASGVGTFAVGVGYFNECMTGFEYQVASHMIYEGAPDSELVKQGVAITRAIHDRYHPSRRNPYNEIECSDHYSRAMASFGVFLALCGFEYDGPHGHIGFAPRLSPEKFRAPFVAAEGWGTFTQTRAQDEQAAELNTKWGTLRITSIALQVPEHRSVRSAMVLIGDRSVDVVIKQKGQHVLLNFAEETLSDERPMKIRLTY